MVNIKGHNKLRRLILENANAQSNLDDYILNFIEKGRSDLVEQGHKELDDLKKAALSMDPLLYKDVMKSKNPFGNSCSIYDVSEGYKRKVLTSQDAKIITGIEKILGKEYKFNHVRVNPESKLRSEYVVIFKRNNFDEKTKNKLELSMRHRNNYNEFYVAENVIPVDDLSKTVSGMFEGHKVRLIEAYPEARYESSDGNVARIINHEYLLIVFNLENKDLKREQLRMHVDEAKQTLKMTKSALRTYK